MLINALKICVYILSKKKRKKNVYIYIERERERERVGFKLHLV